MVEIYGKYGSNIGKYFSNIGKYGSNIGKFHFQFLRLLPFIGTASGWVLSKC